MENLENESVIENPVKKKISKKVLSIIFALVVVAAAIGAYFYIEDMKEKEHTEMLEKYESTLNDFYEKAFESATLAESITNQYSKVWHAAIWDKAVMVGDDYYFDFDSAIQAQYKVFSTNGKLDGMLDGLDLSNKAMKKMKNPPMEFEEEYEAASELQDSLNDFVSLAKNPTGSLQSFNQSTNEKDSQVSADLQKLENLLD
ncbi:hypothetical protein ACQKM9_20065 [Viridibacillus sp. NPDC093762]|uniref:hypothetical protein n=1 Tax=Viridibacillus sp. NPDC093762 TaxID=3390720 RepID=UPI003D01294D